MTTHDFTTELNELVQQLLYVTTWSSDYVGPPEEALTQAAEIAIKINTLLNNTREVGYEHRN